MIVVAGPPGSGKSSVFRPDEAQIDYFNADDRARDLNGGSARKISPDVRATVNDELERFIAEHILRKHSFAYETTLRTAVTFRQARLAKSQGFETTMLYVALSSVEECVRRVRARAEQGGHSAPPDRIREIYRSSLTNFPQALREFDLVTVYDNTDSTARAPSLLLRAAEGALIHVANQMPEWIQDALSGTEFAIA